MRSTRVLVVKHGDSHHKYDGVYGGPTGCRGLTDLGRWQAERLRDRLKTSETIAQPVAVYSSIIPRAVETARILAEAVGGVDVVQDCGLCTYHMAAEMDGMPWEEIHREYDVLGGGVFLPFQKGGESWSDLVIRVSKALTTIAARHPRQTVIVAAHTEVVEASLIAFGALPIYRTFDVRVDPTSVTEWITTDDPSASWDTASTPWLPVRWTLARFNDNAHTTRTPNRFEPCRAHRPD
jgi:broad specificity phosphatase PhoE